MAEKRTIQVPVTLPAKDECKACVVRLKETMEQTKGVLEVEIPERSSTMTVHFDPDLLTLRRLEEQSQDACSRLAATYCHRSLVLGGLDCADCARSIERAVGRRKGVLYASVNFATSRLFLEMNCGDDILDDVRKDVRDLGYQVWTDEEYKEYRRQANPRPFYLRSRRALLTLVSFAFLLVGSVFWIASDPPLHPLDRAARHRHGGRRLLGGARRLLRPAPDAQRGHERADDGGRHRRGGHRQLGGSGPRRGALRLRPDPGELGGGTHPGFHPGADGPLPRRDTGARRRPRTRGQGRGRAGRRGGGGQARITGADGRRDRQGNLRRRRVAHHGRVASKSQGRGRPGVRRYHQPAGGPRGPRDGSSRATPPSRG